MSNPISFDNRWITTTPVTHWVRIGQPYRPHYTQKSFPFLRCGGKRKALKLAREFRDEAEASYNQVSDLPVDFHAKKGQCVYHYTLPAANGGYLEYFAASYRDKLGKKNYMKWYAVSVYGIEQAEILAYRWRNKMRRKFRLRK